MLNSVRPFRNAHGAMRHAALVVLALAAFGWQSLITQTHFHLRSSTCVDIATWTECASPAKGTQHGKSGSDQDSGCLLCHELALSGHYLAAAGISFTAPVLVAHWLAESPMLPALPQTRSHIWKSRAPPARA